MGKYKYRTKQERLDLEIPYRQRYTLRDSDKKIRIDELDWPVRVVWRIIENLKVETIGELLNFADIDLLKMKGLSRISVRFVNAYLLSKHIPDKCKIINGKMAWSLEVSGRITHKMNLAYEHDAEFVANLLTNLGYEIEWNREEQDI